MADVFNGIVASVGVFPIKESIKNDKVTKPGPHFGKQFNIDKTHSIAIKVVGLKVNGEDYTKWINVRHQKFSEGQELSLRLETGGEWKDVWEGSEILFFYEITNAGFVNIVDKGKMALTKQAPRPEKVYTFGNVQTENTGGGGQSFKKDMTGIEAGHALNGGFAWCQYTFDASKILEASKNVHDVTRQLKEEYKAQNPSMSEYDAGATVGAAILNACRIGGTKDELLGNARKILSDLVPGITAYVKGETPTPEQKSEEPPMPEPPPSNNNGDPGFDPDLDVPF